MSETKRRGRQPLSLEERIRRKQERAKQTVELHLVFPVNVIEQMDAVTDNRTRYAIDSVLQRLQRDTNA